MRRDFLICLTLAAVTLIAFWPVGRLGFILLDDPQYVTENTNIQAGITLKSLGWAFTTLYASNWHPVTWLSHMLDYQWFGLNAGGHHGVSLGFHIANTLLLFVWLRQMTGTAWRSALVAGLFALHPMRVESVAWISERKDVLSGFFFLLTLWAYTRYAQGRSSGESRESSAGSGRLALDARRSTLDYFLVLLFYALGLMSKPMLVTVPVILLLLDGWPLGRWRPATAPEKNRPFILPPATGNLEQLMVEKLPLWGLSLASGLATLLAQNEGGTIVPADHLPWYWRVADSPVFVTGYLVKTIWPFQLAIFYPYTRIPAGEFVCAALAPIGLLIFCLRRVRTQPYLLAGGCWFGVMLLPVIGLVQAGMQSMADRYTYLPSIGLFIMLAWGMAGAASDSRYRRAGLALGGTGLALGCLLATRVQLHYWQNDVALFGHAVEVTGENTMGNFYLANACGEAGNLDQAARNFRITLEGAPDFEKAREQLGRVYLLQKKYAEAETQFREILAADPGRAGAHKHLGDAFAAQGKYDAAETEYSTAMQLSPNDTATREARTLARLKARSETALTNLYHSLKLQPTPEAHLQIANYCMVRGEYREANNHYLEALRLKPDSPDILNNLAWLLAACPDAHIRDGAQAVQHAERACEMTHYQTIPFIGTLAAAYAEAGRFDEAMAAAEKACALAAAADEPALLERNRQLLVLYRAHKPYHEAAEKLVPAAP